MRIGLHPAHSGIGPPQYVHRSTAIRSVSSTTHCSWSVVQLLQLDDQGAHQLLQRAPRGSPTWDDQKPRKERVGLFRAEQSRNVRMISDVSSERF
ncbi:hypothetical protein J6590_052930 [Homalodisca vitripennis]|nr:hypothetical protein J6590_052930 [Homalodisca vitripennis]